jgi:hypothetical protein
MCRSALRVWGRRTSKHPLEEEFCFERFLYIFLPPIPQDPDFDGKLLYGRHICAGASTAQGAAAKGVAFLEG